MSKRVLIVGVCAVTVVLAIGAVFALSTWGDVTRVSIDRDVLVGDDSSDGDGRGSDANVDDGPVAAPTGGDGLDVFLLVGSDSRDELESTEGFGEFEGQRADVVMVLFRPNDGSRAALLSIPRDLLVDDVCSSSTEHKLNDSLEGCDAVNGPTALTLTVESLIDQTIDHFALVDLAGFQEAVDAVGGYEICLERPVRDRKAQLELSAGCTQATGAETLAWLRSRSTQELTESGWQTVPGVSDLTRNERQREFLLTMMGQLSDFGSPKDVADVAQVIAPYVTVDSELSLLGAVDLAWTLRGLSGGVIAELEIPVLDSTTSSGAAVLIAQVDIAELVEDFLNSETSGEATGAVPG